VLNLLLNMERLITFKKFPDLEQASELIDLLDANDIQYEVEDNTRAVADYIIGQDIECKILIKISAADFRRANLLLDRQAEQEIENVEPDYYLFAFANDELIEVVAEPDAWCDFDYQLAKKILKDRGVEISGPVEQTLHEKRLRELSTEEKGNTIWMVVGYISAFLGGLLGIAIGLNLWRAKRTLPNGERVFVYNEKDRMHGMVIACVGIIVFVGVIVWSLC
jgi:hypothetical protein